MLKWEYSSQLALLFLGLVTSIGSKASGKVIIYYTTYMTISLSLYILVNECQSSFVLQLRTLLSPWISALLCLACNTRKVR